MKHFNSFVRPFLLVMALLSISPLSLFADVNDGCYQEYSFGYSISYDYSQNCIRTIIKADVFNYHQGNAHLVGPFNIYIDDVFIMNAQDVWPMIAQEDKEGDEDPFKGTKNNRDSISSKNFTFESNGQAFSGKVTVQNLRNELSHQRYSDHYYQKEGDNKWSSIEIAIQLDNELSIHYFKFDSKWRDHCDRYNTTKAVGGSWHAGLEMAPRNPAIQKGAHAVIDCYMQPRWDEYGTINVYRDGNLLGSYKNGSNAVTDTESTCWNEPTYTYQYWYESPNPNGMDYSWENVQNTVIPTITTLQMKHGNYVEDPIPSVMVKAATCTAKAVYHLSCPYCHQPDTTQTFVAGDTLGHDYSVKERTYLATSATCGLDQTYYMTCSRCGDIGTETWADKGTATGKHSFADSDVNHSMCQDCQHSFIYYTSSDGKIVNPTGSLFDADGRILNLVKNTYTDGQGLMEFDGPLAKIENQAFLLKSTLTSITLPSMLQNIGYRAFYSAQKLERVVFTSIPAVGTEAFFANDATQMILSLSDLSYVYTGTDRQMPALTAAPTYTRAVDGNWGTLVLPFATQGSDDVRFHVLSAEAAAGGTSFSFDPLDEVIPAGTPCVFHRINEELSQLTFTATSTTLDVAAIHDKILGQKWTMKASYAATTESANAYVISQDRVVKLSGATQPFSAWFVTSADELSPLFNIVTKGSVPYSAGCELTNIVYNNDGTVDVTVKLRVFNYHQGNAHFVDDFSICINLLDYIDISSRWDMLTQSDKEGKEGTFKGTKNNQDLIYDKHEIWICNGRPFDFDLTIKNLRNEQTLNGENCGSGDGQKKWSTVEMTFRVHPIKDFYLKLKSKWRDHCDGVNTTVPVDWSYYIPASPYPSNLRAENTDIGLKLSWSNSCGDNIPYGRYNIYADSTYIGYSECTSFYDLKATCDKTRQYKVTYSPVDGVADYDSPFATNTISARRWHTNVEVSDSSYLHEVATCNFPTKYYYGCSVCQQMTTDEYEVGDPLGHTFDAADTDHLHCTRCDHYLMHYTTTDKLPIHPATATPFRDATGQALPVLYNLGGEEGCFFEFAQPLGQIDGAFASQATLSSILLPTSLNYIGLNSFAQCGNLTQVVLRSIPDADTTAFQQTTPNFSLALTDDSYVSATTDNALPALAIAPTYTRSVDSQWGTLCLPFAIQSNEELQLYAYQCSVIDGEQIMIFNATDEVLPAGTPCVFKLKQSDASSICLTANDTNIAFPDTFRQQILTQWWLNGTFNMLSDQVGIYYIEDDKIVHATSPVTLLPFRCWFSTTTQYVTSSYQIADGATTAITAPATEACMQPTVIHDLYGRRLSAPRQGQIVIVNGRKMLVK